MKTFAAALALAAALGSAGAAAAQDFRIAFGDLDLSTTTGAQHFDRRVDRAARAACAGGSRLESTRCVNTFKAEAQALLPSARRDEYARTRSLQSA